MIYSTEESINKTPETTQSPRYQTNIIDINENIQSFDLLETEHLAEEQMESAYEEYVEQSKKNSLCIPIGLTISSL